MIQALVFAAAVAATHGRQCLPIESTHITAAHLSAADARFSSLAPERVFGLAPMPGFQRLIRAVELAGFAKSAGLSFTPVGDVCFEWRTTPLSHEDVLAAMRQTLPDARLTLAEVSELPAPQGTLHFPRSGLQRSEAGTAIWRGFVAYASSGRFPVWAKVQVSIPATRIVTNTVIPAGTTIDSTHVRLEDGDFPLSSENLISRLEDVVGKVARGRLQPGEPISETDLRSSPDIRQGDAVAVRVISGGARLTLVARAASSASKGQPIRLKNESSGRIFTAIVEDSGRAVVRAGSL